MNRPRRRRSRTIRGWLAISALAPLLMFAAASWYDRAAVLGRAHESMAATTHALAEHAQAVTQSADLALTIQLDRIKDMDWPQIGESRPVHDFLVGLVRQIPQLESAFYVDPQGYNSASSREYPMHRYNDQDREYYRRAAAGQTTMAISAPFRGATAGTTAFVVSRARVRDHHFDGLAGLTLSPAYFREFYQTVLLWHEGATAALLRDDGTVLVSYPEDSHLPPRLAPGSILMRALSGGAASGVVTGTSRQDGQHRLVAFRRLPGSGMAVAYSLALEGVLAPWYRHVAIFGIFALLTAAALLMIARRAVVQAERQRAHLTALLDETQRRQRAEAALQQAGKLEALGRLTGGVAHDFNNLLAAVLGSLELALHRVVEPRARRQLEVARQAAQRGARLTAQMLAFARNHAVELRAIDLNAVVHEADPLLRRTCGSLVRLDHDLHDGLWPVLADPVQIELALLNLASNARDAMPDGGVLAVRTRNLPAGAAPAGLADADHVLIALADSGPGMPDAVRERAFEPFFTTKELGKGTGLGLSMVYGLARQLGGTATIESAPGRGTTVNIYLPRSRLAVAHDIAAAPVTEAVPPLRILLVDDDATVRAAAREMLLELGQIVTEAGSGADALEQLREGTFDLLLADFAMPGMNGSELAAAARRLRPQLRVVFMTGYVEPEHLGAWVAQGHRTVQKPFDLAGLADALRQTPESSMTE